jgi:ABC-type multidrug transport system ATPase subunit
MPVQVPDRDAGAVTMSDAPALGIHLEGLEKRFGAQAALAGIDLDVPPGSYVAVMGANGAGKTTLLRVIAGLIAPTAGRVSIGGVDMRRAGHRLRAELGVLGHGSMLYADLTAKENLRFHARLFGVPDPDDAIAGVTAMLDIGEVLDLPVRALSRGTAQRVALARALVHGPRVLLLDEPYTGLDDVAAIGLADVLDRLHAPNRVLIVTLHDVARAIDGPERLLVLSHGRVVLDEPMRTSVGDLAEEYLRLLRLEVAS